MGLSIHYSGTLKDPALLPKLIEEVSDLTAGIGWDCQRIQSQRDGLDGICFGPDGCEPLFFTFNDNGVLINPIYLEHKIEPVTTVSTKTQYAGKDAHIAIIKLIRHLSKKYFSSFELMDEGQYWETDDENVLKGRFGFSEAAINMLVAALENMDRIPEESADSMANRITKMLEEIDKKDNQ